MDPDLLFVLGISLGVLVIPAIVSALIDGRAPRTPAFLLILCGVMVGYAMMQRPSLSFNEIPQTFSTVITRYAR